VTQQNISYHLQQIEESGELHLSDAYKKILLPSDKWSGEVMMYNLDVVIAVGYRVNSYEATQFRIWATQVLKEYLTKGFVYDSTWYLSYVRSKTLSLQSAASGPGTWDRCARPRFGYGRCRTANKACRPRFYTRVPRRQ
jgi:hypothetical protein